MAMVHTVCHAQPVNTECPAVFGRREKGEEMEYSEIYAVDFDKTLNLAEKYPDLGQPNIELIEILKDRRAAGDKIILWTCREGEFLNQAVEYCKKYGLEFDAVNDNLPENVEFFGNNCRKVWAHHYVDDRNWTPEGLCGSVRIKEGIQKLIFGIDTSSGKDATGWHYAGEEKPDA